MIAGGFGSGLGVRIKAMARVWVRRSGSGCPWGVLGVKVGVPMVCLRVTVRVAG